MYVLQVDSLLDYRPFSGPKLDKCWTTYVYQSYKIHIGPRLAKFCSISGNFFFDNFKIQKWSIVDSTMVNCRFHVRHSDILWKKNIHYTIIYLLTICHDPLNQTPTTKFQKLVIFILKKTLIRYVTSPWYNMWYNNITFSKYLDTYYQTSIFILTCWKIPPNSWKFNMGRRLVCEDKFKFKWISLKLNIHVYFEYISFSHTKLNIVHPQERWIHWPSVKVDSFHRR